jgi:hypothetical protein
MRWHVAQSTSQGSPARAKVAIAHSYVVQGELIKRGSGESYLRRRWHSPPRVARSARKSGAV